jgi:hypothetical protein
MKGLHELWEELAEKWLDLEKLDRAIEAHDRAEEIRRLGSSVETHPRLWRKYALAMYDLANAMGEEGLGEDTYLARDRGRFYKRYAAYLTLTGDPEAAEMAARGHLEAVEKIAQQLRGRNLNPEEMLAFEVARSDFQSYGLLDDDEEVEGDYDDGEKVECEDSMVVAGRGDSSAATKKVGYYYKLAASSDAYGCWRELADTYRSHSTYKCETTRYAEGMASLVEKNWDAALDERHWRRLIALARELCRRSKNPQYKSVLWRVLRCVRDGGYLDLGFDL